jgi:hypothetical protein
MPVVVLQLSVNLAQVVGDHIGGYQDGGQDQ